MKNILCYANDLPPEGHDLQEGIRSNSVVPIFFKKLLFHSETTSKVGGKIFTDCDS